MSINSKIEWTHHTANLWHGCTKVHEGCDHCYAETLSHRWGRDIWGNDKPRMEIKSVWNDLAKQQKTAAASGEMHRVFVGSMMDIFEKPMPLIDSKGNPAIINGVRIDTGNLRNALFDAIDKEMYPNLIFLFLTKRPSNINKYIPENWKQCPPANVMFGTSPVNQETANKLIPQLIGVKGRRFLSIEPLLGPIDFRKLPMFPNYIDDVIDWVIVGGESGHGARPMHPDWVRSIRDQCEEQSIPFFLKQWGNWLPWEHDAQPPFFNSQNGQTIDGHALPDVSDHPKWDDGLWAVTEDLGACIFENVGKKKAGRELDGKIHDGYPSF